MTVRYGAVVHALQSLRGTVAQLQPTLAAVPYRTRTRGIAPLADIYLPTRPNGASALLVHGGAFVIGSRRMKPMRFLAARLVASGIAVCTIDYRMIFRGGRFDEAVDDVRAALDFWCQRAPGHGLDGEAVSMIGLSAGGSLGLYAAAHRDAPLARLACCFGLYETEHLRGLSSVLPRLLFRTRDRTKWRFAAGQPAVPTLLLHGDADGLVPVEQAHRLAAQRESLGLPTRLVVYPGAPHGFFNVPGTAADSAVRELVDHVTGHDVVRH